MYVVSRDREMPHINMREEWLLCGRDTVLSRVHTPTGRAKVDRNKIPPSFYSTPSFDTQNAVDGISAALAQKINSYLDEVAREQVLQQRGREVEKGNAVIRGLSKGVSFNEETVCFSAIEKKPISLLSVERGEIKKFYSRGKYLIKRVKRQHEEQLCRIIQGNVSDVGDTFSLNP